MTAVEGRPSSPDSCRNSAIGPSWDRPRRGSSEGRPPTSLSGWGLGALGAGTAARPVGRLCGVWRPGANVRSVHGGGRRVLHDQLVA